MTKLIPSTRLDIIETIDTPPKRRLTPIWWSEIHSLPKREPLIDGLLDRGAMSIDYGGTGTGKTFWALDISAHVGLGWDWRGRKVRHGMVVYVAAEGGLGFSERLTGYQIHHNIKTDGVPLCVIPEPIDLCRGDDVVHLLKRISELPKQPSLELIVIDTLSRAMSGGNENGPDDMGRFVRNCDQLRIETHAHVLIVHHSGKDDNRGARGHSLLRAAVDTEIEVVKNETTGIASATVTKQRDHISGDVFSFKLHPVEIGQKADGSPITSCVLLPVEITTNTNTTETRLTKNQKTMFAILYDAGERGLSLEKWNELAREAGIGTKRKADLYDVRSALEAKRCIRQVTNGWAVNHQ
jgi:hypothetical protein